jgi:hypothetical protein
MYFLKSGIKDDPELRWNLPDRIFFGYGACHILAGVYLDVFPSSRYRAHWIKPIDDFYGYHIFVSDGTVAFDFHGYSMRERLITHHKRGWSRRYPGWRANIEEVDFSLLDTQSLNAIKMLGPDQYLYSPIERARVFLEKYEHSHVDSKTQKLNCA